MASGGKSSKLIAAASLLALAACDSAGVNRPSPGVLPTPSAPAYVETTAKSAAAFAYYAQVQAALSREGMLRTDTGAEVPITAEILAENFLRIALFDEYRRGTGGFVQEETESRLRRWEVPVRIAVRFGASVPLDRQAADLAEIARFTARLSAVTGHPISLDNTAPNFWIHIVSEDERESLGPQARATIPSLGPGELAGITAMPRTTYCLVYALSDGDSGAYTDAFAVIRAEHPDLLRLSCLHEEITQGLGLPNDSPRARPSIFNDDEEFAFLTRHDELLLRILYSPELRPGMTPAEARPIVFSLARSLLGGET